MNLRTVCTILPALLVCFSLAGCTQEDAYRVPTVDEADATVPDEHGGHHHHAHGPHGGSIVELGTHDIHAESILDEDDSRLDIYILGSDAETAQAIDATSLTLSFKHGDESEDFELTAVPQDGDAEGKASKFSITSEDLSQELHHHKEGAALQFMADGIAYTGTVVHDEEHAHGHGDEHGDEDGDEHGHEDGEDSDEGHGTPKTTTEDPESTSDAPETSEAKPAAPEETESTESTPPAPKDAK